MALQVADLKGFGAEIATHAGGREDRAHLDHLQFIIGLGSVTHGKLFRRLAQELHPVAHDLSLPRARAQSASRLRSRASGMPARSGGLCRQLPDGSAMTSRDSITRVTLSSCG